MKTKTIVKLITGSNLYGTNTQNSDMDYKGIMLPTWEQVALGKIPKQFENSSTGNNNSKNTSEDVDIEIFSLHEFIKLAKEGQTLVFDMLHAPKDKLIISSDIWEELVSKRSMFYSKNITSFLGYCRSQVIKYSVKGDRLKDAEYALNWIKEKIDKHENYEMKLELCDLSTFPQGENIRWIKTENIPDMVEICNRKYLVTASLGYIYNNLYKIVKNYGERSKQAAKDKCDFKAIYHAFRVAYQAKELFEYETITFPRPEKDFLLDIRNEKYTYEELSHKLDDLINEVELIRTNSSLPDNPDIKRIDDWVIKIVSKYLVPKKY